jgi:FAD:protein FMN transferase
VKSMRLNSKLVAGLVLTALITAPVDATDPTAFIHKKKYVMGTIFEIVAYETASAPARDAIDAAFQEIVRLDHLMSNYNSESDLSRLNRSARLQPHTVPPDLYRVIEESLRYSKLSEGRFDVTVAPLVDFWKAVMHGERTPAVGEERRLRTCVGYEKIKLLPPDRVEFRGPCLQIDLGAIGKGYAVDRAVTILRSRGISRALIDAGGSTIFAIGSPPRQSSWLVHLRDPSGKIDPQVKLSDNSVSTSEQTAPSVLGNNYAGHIIDPESGVPVNSTVAVSAVAKTATASDALSTTLFLLGPEKGKRLIDSTSDTAAIWISPGGEVEMSATGRQIFFEHGGVQLGARPADSPEHSIQ